MSVVSTVILNTFYEPPEVLMKVNAHLAGAGHPVGLLAIPPGSGGGSKVAQTQLYWGSYDHLDLAALLAAVEAIAFSTPEAVQLLVQREWEVTFAVHAFDGPRLVERLQAVDGDLLP